MTAVWAHRGSAGAGVRENTLEAFRAAHDQGAHGVELDVRSTADGVVVVHHDPALEDGRPVALVAAPDLPGWVPTLEAALEECRGLTVDVEVKNLPTDVGYDPAEGTATRAATVVRRMGLTDGVVVSAFALPTLNAAREAVPGLSTGWLTLAGSDQLEAVRLVAACGHSALHPRHEAVDPALVAAAHAAGISVHTWTVDDPDRIRALAAAGVDAVITNVVAVALAALAP